MSKKGKSSRLINNKASDNEKEFPTSCSTSEGNIFVFLFKHNIFGRNRWSVGAMKKGKQGSMIIKLTKDKKIVNDMFKQEMFV